MLGLEYKLKIKFRKGGNEICWSKRSTKTRDYVEEEKPAKTEYLNKKDDNALFEKSKF